VTPRAPGARRAELVASLSVLGLGLGATAVAIGLPEGGGYARIGPNFVPKLVAGALVLLGAWLLAEWASGPDADPHPADHEPLVPDRPDVPAPGPQRPVAD